MTENYEQRLHIAQANIQMLASELDEQQEMVPVQETIREASSASKRLSIPTTERQRGSLKPEIQASSPLRKITEPVQRAITVVQAASAFDKGKKDPTGMYKRENPVKIVPKRVVKPVQKREVKPKKEQQSWYRKASLPLRRLHVSTLS